VIPETAKFHRKMQCFVESIKYDFESRLGTVFVHEDGCTDMSGAIATFKRIDPKVEMVVVYSGDDLDIVYQRRNKDWDAHCFFADPDAKRLRKRLPA
jgi:hypothetical protein